MPEGADAYILCGVIHDWDDSRAITIRRNCRRAMAEKGRVLLVDMVVPDTDAMSFSKLLDLNMLAMTGGRERTKAEFRALLDAAEYKLTRIIPTMAPQSVIEAVPKRSMAKVGQCEIQRAVRYRPTPKAAVAESRLTGEEEGGSILLPLP